MTKSATEFVTPLSLQALTEDRIYSDIFSLTDESEMGHIQLSRNSDLILVAPATANFLAKMRLGICDDLASTVVLATDKPVMVASDECSNVGSCGNSGKYNHFKGSEY